MFFTLKALLFFLKIIHLYKKYLISSKLDIFQV